MCFNLEAHEDKVRKRRTRKRNYKTTKSMYRKMGRVSDTVKTKVGSK